MMQTEQPQISQDFLDAQKLAKAQGRTRKRSGSRSQHHRVEAKKAGAGGKGTWGKVGDELRDAPIDHADPNYNESDVEVEEDVVVPTLSLSEIDVLTRPLLVDFFEHGDPSDVVEMCLKMNCGTLCHRPVELLINLCMDRGDAQCELASQLIVALERADAISPQSLERAFDCLLGNLNEFQLDNPRAAGILSKFMARAVADDCIPPAFVMHHKALTDETVDSEIARCIFKTRHLLTQNHAMSRLDHIWGFHGQGKPVGELREQVSLLVKEHLSCKDLKEAERCLQDLGVPHFHHELVYQCLLHVLENGHKHDEVQVLAAMLQHLYDSALVTADQLSIGFRRVFDQLEDLELDMPRANVHLQEFVKFGITAGFVPRQLMDEMPNRATRKRYRSENDGGKLKVNAAVAP